jgi:hypothetical protein
MRYKAGPIQLVRVVKYGVLPELGEDGVPGFWFEVVTRRPWITRRPRKQRAKRLG